MKIEQIKPLTLSDLAIDKSLELDKRSIAAMFGVPPFLVGVGEFKAEEFNWFVANRLMRVARVIEQTLTRALLLRPAAAVYHHGAVAGHDGDALPLSDIQHGYRAGAVRIIKPCRYQHHRQRGGAERGRAEELICRSGPCEHCDQHKRVCKHEPPNGHLIVKIQHGKWNG